MSKKIDDLLANWLSLTDGISALSIKELEQALKQEVNGNNRKSFIERLHARIGVLKRDKERKELLGE